MNFIKEIDVIKSVNIATFVLVLCMLILMYFTYDNWCTGKDIQCSYDFYDGIYNPLYAAGKVLLVILGVLLLFPSQVFRKWLYVAPFVILLTFNRVLAVSVYSSGIGTIDRVHMAQYGMYLLGIITIVLIIIDYLKTRKSAQR